MRTRIVAATALTLLLALAAAPHSTAQQVGATGDDLDTGVTASMDTPSGGRTLTVPSEIDVTLDPDTATNSSLPFDVLVTELLANGLPAGWSVTADLCGVDGGGAALCTVDSEPNNVLNHESSDTTIPGDDVGLTRTAALDISATNVGPLTNLLNPCTSTASLEAGAFTQSRSVIECLESGQATGTAYVGVYTWVGTLDVGTTELFESGDYDGYVRFTLDG